MTRCHRCEIDVLHCHGTLVLHDDESRECSAPDCTGDVDVHDLVLTCSDAWAGCCAPAPRVLAG